MGMNVMAHATKSNRMKKTILAVFSMAALLAPAGAIASGLVPEQCTVGVRPVYHPLADIGLTFDGEVAVDAGAGATVLSEGSPVASGKLSASNYTGKDRTQGSVVVTFEEPLTLPKGRAYTLVVPEGAIFRPGDHSVYNDRISVDFEVPESLGLATPSVEEGSTLCKASRIGFYFAVETAPVEGGEAILYREGAPLKRYPCDVSWDWGLGYAGIDFGQEVCFEDGVEYAITLPEGAVSALHRPDITNGEACVRFKGGYAEPAEQIQYVWCSLFTEHPSDVIGVVRFYYDRPVELAADPVVRLCIEGEGVVVKEAEPTIAEENGMHVMTVDFDDTPLMPEKGYTIVIPEGTLISGSGGIAVNPQSVMEVPGVSGIKGTESAGCGVHAANGAVAIEGTACGDRIIMAAADGRVVYDNISGGGAVHIPVERAGIYLISINGRAYKIAVSQ